MTQENPLKIIEQAAKDRSKKLDLSRKNLGSLPSTIGKLQHLTWLDLSDNSLSYLPSEISQLKNLNWLYLGGNQLSLIPAAVGDIQGLSLLNLSRNRLKSLPLKLGNLKNLTELDLSRNKFTTLPSGITKLSSLTWLDLSGNRLKSLPVEITALQTLIGLNLSDNQLTELPAEIDRLQNLIELNLKGNSLDLPVNIINSPQKTEVILKHYEQIQKPLQEQDQVYEAKLIILGEGGAGKTTLAKKIKDENYQLRHDEESTVGIDIIQWPFRNDGKEFRVNIWDFSGQEIEYSTHQFFLTEQSLYVLVADTRRENANFFYWLEIVELLGKNSPILIVKNEKQDRVFDINDRKLKGRFSNLKSILSTNLSDNRGLSEIRNEIKHYVNMLPHTGKKLSKIEENVRKALEKEPRNYLNQDNYFDICRHHGLIEEEQQLKLSKHLHELGICLHFQNIPLLSKTIILNPNLCTDAVYKVFNNEKVKQNSGEFTEADLGVIWHEKKYAKVRSELLQLMLEFKLCYRIPRTKDTYIAPQLLPSIPPEPEEYEWNESDNLILRCMYEFMPRGIITRFIVEIPSYIDKINVWRSGITLHLEKTFAEVTENYRQYEGEIQIRVTGKDKKGLLSIIVHELNRIHDSYENLKFRRLVPCNCSICQNSQAPHLHEFERLRQFEASNQHAIQCYLSFKMVNVRDLLDGVGWLGEIKPEMVPEKEVFISYAWGEKGEEREEIVNHLCEDFKERGIKIIRDKKDLSFKESIQEFMECIGRGRCVIAVISDKYLKSRNCMFELVQVAKAGQFHDRIFPVILPDAKIYDPIEFADYILHWQEKCTKLQSKLDQLTSSAHLPRLHRERDLYEEVRATIDRLVGILQDMNVLPTSMLVESGFDELFKAIEHKLAE